uniref:GAG-pre-integrase domain-containing protein n=1 Tax=Chenopodium quinoa TaxID=63459 RepID=A0A803MXP6_CHEQI
MKLREEFSQVRANILMIYPLPTISHAYRLLIQEERHKEVYTSSHSAQGMAFAAANKIRFYEPNLQQNNRFDGNNNTGTNRVGGSQSFHPWNQSQRRQPNYFCDHCWKVNGYPAHFKENWKGKGIAATIHGDFDKEEFQNNTDSTNTAKIFVPTLTKPLLLGRLRDGLYCLAKSFFQDTQESRCAAVHSQSESCLDSHSINNVKLWHPILGHMPIAHLNKVKPDLDTKDYFVSCTCQVCHFARQHRLSFVFIANQFGARIKGVRADNAPELCDGDMRRFYTKEGIFHQSRCTETLQQSGVAVRKQKHLLETARALYFQSNVPARFKDQNTVDSSAAQILNSEDQFDLETLLNTTRIMSLMPNTFLKQLLLNHSIGATRADRAQFNSKQRKS